MCKTQVEIYGSDSREDGFEFQLKTRFVASCAYTRMNPYETNKALPKSLTVVQSYAPDFGLCRVLEA